MACPRIHNCGDQDLGSADWFCVELELNHYGYVPGAPRRERDTIPDNISDESVCTQRWGKKKGGKFWYAKKGSSESPRMKYRIEKLYQVTHQKPIGNQRGISLGFARGLLAEKRGYAVDWATYAAKQCKRGNKPFQSIEVFKSNTKAQNGEWPKNDVFGEDESLFDGAPDDWEVNRMVKDLNPQLRIGYNLKRALPTIPEYDVAPPTYSGGGKSRVTFESKTVEASSEEESKDVEDYGGDEENEVEGETVSMWQGESSRGNHRASPPCHKWNGCPLSPNVSAGFPDGARRIYDESKDDDGHKNCPSPEYKEGGLNETLPRHGKGEHTYVPETHTETLSEDGPLHLDDFMEVYGRVCDEMDHQASRDGFELFTAEQQSRYLRDREAQYESQWRKRRAEESARMQWIAAKRSKTEYPRSQKTGKGLQSSRDLGEQSDSDDLDMYERPGAVTFGSAGYDTGVVSASSLEELVRVSGGGFDISDAQPENEGELAIPFSPTSMSPLRFANLPLLLPEDIENESTSSKETGSGKSAKTSTIIIPDSDTD